LYKIPANTLFLGKNLVFMPECHSTNTFALELCQQSPGSAEGTVVITANQSSGRGQRGNVWIVEPGKNLTFSVILRPSFLAIQDQFYLNIFSALAICDYLKEHSCESVRIKWPNDIYVREKKICGILIESQLQGSQITSSILGIGLNINQRNFTMDTATSLNLETGRHYNLQDELELMLGFLEARYLQLRQLKLQSLKTDYLNNMYWINEEHTFQSQELGTFNGAICGLDPAGQLLIRIDGKEKAFGIKDVVYSHSLR
jgi:BirA family biotin operon repressor/biotin-[acetyl-CoA-carboxylase] ligase